MNAITAADYFMGRDVVYPHELTDEIRANVEETVRRVNELLGRMVAEGVELERHPVNGTLVASGWRPPQINAAVANAAAKSKHMTGEACDLYDPEGELDEFCMGNPEVLAELGLYLEHPSATKNWCHVQTVAPRSGRQVFYP